MDRAVILAIGNPVHCHRLTYNRVHAMLPALGKPLVARVMDRLYRIGIRQYTIIVGENEGAVASYLNSQWMPDVQVEFMLKSGFDSVPKLLQSIARKYQQPFIVCHYNTFTHSNFPERLLRQHREAPHALISSAASASLSASQQQYHVAGKDTNATNTDKIPMSDQRFLPSTNFIICGQDMVEFLCNLQLTKNGSASADFATIAQQFVRASGAALVAETTWMLQIEADHDLLTLNRHLLDEGQDAHILSEVPYTVHITPPIRIDPQVSVGQGARLGPHVYLEKGCSIGRDAVLQNCLILERVNIPPGQTVTNAIVTTRGPIPA
jgi:NDP-sugar pyrophosphorylase family protein